MLSIRCKKCRKEIDDYKKMVQVLEDNGFTASYCEECGKEAKSMMDKRDSSIL